MKGMTLPEVDRRAVLLIASGGLLAACTSAGNGSTSTGSTSAGLAVPSTSSGATGTTAVPRPSPTGVVSTTVPVPSTSSTSSPTVPVVPGWTPSSNDVHPEVKLVAVRVVETLLGWGPGESGTAAARVRLLGLGQAPALVDQAAPMLVADARAAAVEVIDAQYGGILADSASVLVACRQWVQPTSGPVRVGGTTVDVRLRRAGQQWSVTELHPAAPGPASARLSSLASEVLRSGRISLPPASADDIRSGQVHDSVLQAMLSVSAAHTIGVSVVRSGHPIYVFGTSRLSDHPRGRAFDTWQVDGHAVVDPATPRGLVTGYMSAVASAGSYNVGGPYSLGGATYFSDATHHDHVHAGFRA